VATEPLAEAAAHPRGVPRSGATELAPGEVIRMLYPNGYKYSFQRSGCARIDTEHTDLARMGDQPEAEDGQAAIHRPARSWSRPQVAQDPFRMYPTDRVHLPERATAHDPKLGRGHGWRLGPGSNELGLATSRVSQSRCRRPVPLPLLKENR
jgi:hypothetical protein